MEFCKRVIIDKALEAPTEIIKRLKSNRPVTDVSLVILNKQSQRAIMEILEVKEFLKPDYIKRDYIVFAVTSGKTSAFSVVESVLGGYLVENRRYNYDDFVTYLNGLVGSSIYEMVSCCD